jgi:hypothetical protein
MKEWLTVISHHEHTWLSLGREAFALWAADPTAAAADLRT